MTWPRRATTTATETTTETETTRRPTFSPPTHHARGEVYNPFGPPLTLTYHFGSTVTLCQTLAQVLDSRTQRSRTFIMDLNRLDAMLSTQGNPPIAACAEPPSYISMCGLCGEAVLPQDKTWKGTKDHFVCGRRFDLASKACRRVGCLDFYLEKG